MVRCLDSPKLDESGRHHIPPLSNNAPNPEHIGLKYPMPFACFDYLIVIIGWAVRSHDTQVWVTI